MFNPQAWKGPMKRGGQTKPLAIPKPCAKPGGWCFRVPPVRIMIGTAPAAAKEEHLRRPNQIKLNRFVSKTYTKNQAVFFFKDLDLKSEEQEIPENVIDDSQLAPETGWLAAHRRGSRLTFTRQRRDRRGEGGYQWLDGHESQHGSTNRW